MWLDTVTRNLGPTPTPRPSLAPTPSLSPVTVQSTWWDGYHAGMTTMAWICVLLALALVIGFLIAYNRPWRRLKREMWPEELFERARRK